MLGWSEQRGRVGLFKQLKYAGLALGFFLFFTLLAGFHSFMVTTNTPVVTSNEPPKKQEQTQPVDSHTVISVESQIQLPIRWQNTIDYNYSEFDEIAKHKRRKQARRETYLKGDRGLVYGYFHTIDPHNTTDTQLARAMCVIARDSPQKAKWIYGEVWQEMYGVRNKRHKSMFFDQDWTRNLSALRQTIWDIHDRSSLVTHEQYTSMESASLMVGAEEGNVQKIVDLSGLDNCCHIMKVDLLDKEIELPEMTVVMNTWRREKCLLFALQSWRKCDAVSQIVVVSADPETQSRWQGYESLERLLRDGILTEEGKADVHLHRSALGLDRLTDRFKYDPSIMSDVLFPVDDDIVYDCDCVTEALKLYSVLNEGKNENRIALSFGQSSRRLKFSRIRPNMVLVNDPVYDALDDKKLRCDYNCGLLTLGGIIHKEYWLKLHDPSNGQMNEIRRMVDGNITAEDMALSLIYSDIHDGLPPMNVLEPSRRMIMDIKNCSLSSEMHSNSRIKRRDIAHSTARILGFTQQRLRTLRKFRLFFNLRLDHSHPW